MAKGGRKVYRTSSVYRKKRAKKAFKIFFLIIFLAALIFCGYSIAKPVYNYLSNKSEQNSEGSESSWIPPVLEENDETYISSDEPEDTLHEATTEQNTEEAVRSDKFSAYQIPVTALSSTDALIAALNNAKSFGYTAVSVNLKAEGGKIYYLTDSEMAKLSDNAIEGTMYAPQIASIIKNAGFTPVAYVNLLEDNNFYGAYKFGAYRIAGEDSTWYDNDPSRGGKPWLSPFDTDTQSYVEYLSNEVSKAGFEHIVFDGLVFPPLRNSDIGHIGDIVASADRYSALVNIANIAVNAAETNNSDTLIMFSANEILLGSAEAFKPDELYAEKIAVEYAPSEFENLVIRDSEIALSQLSAYEKAQVIFGEIQQLAGNSKQIVPVFRQSDFSQTDLSETISAIADLKCESYIIIQ